MVERKEKPPLDGALWIAEPEPVSQRDADLSERGFAPTSEEDDEKAELAADVLQAILDRMGFETEVEIREDDAEEVVLDIDGVDAGRAIGKRGQTLDALQFLLNKIINRSPEGRRRITVDSGDYRERHEAGLISMARRQAQRALQQGQMVILEPMNARDRRVIHLSLAKFEGVQTLSEGEGLDRRIQIIPAGQSNNRRSIDAADEGGLDE